LRSNKHRVIALVFGGATVDKIGDFSTFDREFSTVDIFADGHAQIGTEDWRDPDFVLWLAG
jgi:hypothetical protein